MDIATILGLLLAVGMLAATVVLSGGGVSSFWDASSILTVLGGTAGAVLVCFPWRTVVTAPRLFRRAMFERPPDHAALIEQLVGLALAARRDGLLVLEPKLDEIESPFLKLGLQLAIDGRQPEVVQEVLRAEIEAMTLRQREGKALLDQCGRFAPSFGMIGTILGLIVMLGNMSDPATIGSGMAVAMVTTLYGLILANSIFLPLAEKLAGLNRQEILASELLFRGILAIQAGEHPRLIEQKLSAFLPPELRPADIVSLRLNRPERPSTATSRAA